MRLAGSGCSRGLGPSASRSFLDGRFSQVSYHMINITVFFFLSPKIILLSDRDRKARKVVKF